MHTSLCQPNVLSSDGSVSLSTASYSRDGKWFAYALSRSVRRFELSATCRSHRAKLLKFRNIIVFIGKRLHKYLHPLD